MVASRLWIPKFQEAIQQILWIHNLDKMQLIGTSWLFVFKERIARFWRKQVIPRGSQDYIKQKTKKNEAKSVLGLCWQINKIHKSVLTIVLKYKKSRLQNAFLNWLQTLVRSHLFTGASRALTPETIFLPKTETAQQNLETTWQQCLSGATTTVASWVQIANQARKDSSSTHENFFGGLKLSKLLVDENILPWLPNRANFTRWGVISMVNLGLVNLNTTCRVVIYPPLWRIYSTAPSLL